MRRVDQRLPLVQRSVPTAVPAATVDVQGAKPSQFGHHSEFCAIPLGERQPAHWESSEKNLSLGDEVTPLPVDCLSEEPAFKPGSLPRQRSNFQPDTFDPGFTPYTLKPQESDAQFLPPFPVLRHQRQL